MRIRLLATVVILLQSCATETRDASDVVERSQQALRGCRYDEAMQLIDASLPTATSTARALLQLGAGTIKERRGDLAGAIALYREAMLADRIPLQAPMVLGIAEVRNQEFEDGHRNLSAYIGTMVKRGEYPSWRAIAADAVALAELGRVPEAHKLLVESIDTLQYSNELLLDLRDLAAKVPAQPAANGRFWRAAFGPDLNAARAMDTEFSPSPLKRVAPQYPRPATRDRVEGHVLVAVNLSPGGDVTGVQVLDSRPPGVFDETVIRAVRQWKFRPASRNCVPTATSTVQKIAFRMAP